MSHFTEQEIVYLRGQRLGRLATVNTRGEPHIAPVGFSYNAELDTIDIGGRRGGFGASRKFHEARATGAVAFVVDDVATGQPRGIEIRGHAEAYETGGDQLGPGHDPAFIRIYPRRIVSWDINRAGYYPDGRDVQ